MIEKMTAGVDWLSMSMRADSTSYHDWRARCYHSVEQIARDGNELKPRSLLGYYGVSAGNCFLGENPSGSYCQLTGHYANEYFSEVYDPKCKVSRIDAQITVKLDVMDKNVGKRAYRDATRQNESLPVSRRRKLWIIVGSDGGDTCYVGSASSEQRGRIYNKEVQSEDLEYTRCWRYEVVLRNELAVQFAATLSNTGGRYTQSVHTLCVEWFRLRGVDTSDMQTGDSVVIPLERKRPSDVNRKLDWLHTQVRPTVKYLIDAGMYDKVISALELDNDGTVIV